MKPEPYIRTLGAARALEQPMLRRAIAIRADLGPALEFATTHGTIRAVFPITGGEARGHGWTALILPGGADFAIGLPDGSYAIEARYCLNWVMAHRSWSRMPAACFRSLTAVTLAAPAQRWRFPSAPTARLVTLSTSALRWPSRATPTTSISSFGRRRSDPAKHE